MSIFTVQGSDGRNIQSVQPVANSVTGAPFTVDAITPITSPELTGLLVVVSTEDMRLRFSKAAASTPASTTDLFIPCKQWFVFPMDGDVMSMLAVVNTGIVYAQMAMGV